MHLKHIQGKSPPQNVYSIVAEQVVGVQGIAPELCEEGVELILRREAILIVKSPVWRDTGKQHGEERDRNEARMRAPIHFEDIKHQGSGETRLHDEHVFT